MSTLSNEETQDNPFYAMLKTNPPELIGRDDVLRQLLRGVSGPTTGAYQIACYRGIGKSAILRFIAHPDGARKQCPHFIQRPYSEEDRLVLIYLDCAQYTDGRLTDLLLAETLATAQLSEWTGLAPDQEPAQRLRRIYAKARQAHRRVVVLLNHFDHLFKDVDVDEATQLRPLVQEASFIVATEKPLVELNEQTYASWFGTMAIEVSLEPLSLHHARELIDAALQPIYKREGLDRRERRQYAAPYVALLPITGRHPAYILRGTAVLYELKETFAAPQVDEEMLRHIARDRLYLHTFKGEFKRYWEKLLDPWQRELLARLVKEEIEPEHDYGRLQLLHYLGLVVWEGGKFQPFSELWGDYIKDHMGSVVATVPQPTAVAPRPLFDNGDTELTPRQKQLLDYLRQYPDEICTYEDILQEVWRRKNTPKDLRLLRETVRQLRPKLQEMGIGQIVNQRGRGYEFRPS